MTTTASTSAMKGQRATTRNLQIGKWLVHIVLVAMIVVWLLPSIGLLVTSFRPQGDIASSGWWTVFSSPRLTADNYNDVLSAQGMGDSFLNSFKLTLPGTILPVLIGSMAAYAFAWIKFRGRDFIFLVVVALLVVPLQTTFVPILQLFNELGIRSALARIWIAHTAYGLPFAIFLLRNFFARLPKDLFEAAKIDGAGELRVFSQIALPLSIPALASLTIFQFMWVWNDLLVALVYINDPQLQPSTVRIQALLGTYATEWHIMSAAAFISMSVPLLVFFALQRYFVTGLTAGAVKA